MDKDYFMTERPVECSQCKKPIKVLYKEITSESMMCLQMCTECPILKQKLYGEASLTKNEEIGGEKESGLYCGHCKTSLESVKMGNPLGCSECYSVFSDLLLNELATAGQIPPYLKKMLATKKTHPIHMGKTPYKSLTIPSSSRLTALNEALNEALKIENYEQAAWLRDQIKTLTEKPNEGKESST